MQHHANVSQCHLADLLCSQPACSTLCMCTAYLHEFLVQPFRSPYVQLPLTPHGPCPFNVTTGQQDTH